MKIIQNLLFLVITFIISYLLLLSPLGLDFTDEGLYLLETGGCNPYSYWFVPFGQVLKQLFALSNYNLGIYRALAFTLIVFLHYYLFTGLYPNKLNKYNKIIIISIIYFSSFFLYTFLNIRTPGYNYVNYLSLILFFSALYNITKSQFHLNLILIFIALNISFASKPTTTFFEILVFLLFILKNKSFTKELILKYRFYSIIVFVVLLLIFWPVHKMQLDMIFKFVEYKVTFLKIQQIGLISHVNGAWLYVRNTLGIIYHLLFIHITLFTLIALFIYRNKLSYVYITFILYLTSIWVYDIITGHDYSYRMQSINLVYLFFAGFYIFKLYENKIAIFSILFVPFVYSFGSGNGYLMMVPQALGIPLIFILTKHVNSFTNNKWLVLTSLLFLLTLYLNFLATPYRSQPYWKCTYPFKEATHNTTVYLEKDQQTLLTDIQSELIEAGWKRSNYLFALNKDWSTTIPYLLGAYVPNTAMTTLFGYENAHTVGLKKLERQITPDKFWIMYSVSDDSIYNKQKHLILSHLLESKKLTLQKHFKLVYNRNSFMVYKPI
jgi:hypothetical protein